MNPANPNLNREPENSGCKAIFIDVPENDIGSSDQFIGNFLETPGDLEHIVKNKIFVTSDTHFSHKNILVYEAANRPFKNKEEMDRVLIQRWNSVVRPCDVVFHLGDFAFAGKTIIKNIMSRLNGRKFLLLGNHDRYKKIDWTDVGFDRVFKNPFKMDGRFIFSHEPLDVVPDGTINIYGHVHSSMYFNNVDANRICVCVERWHCTPIEYETIKTWFSK